MRHVKPKDFDSEFINSASAHIEMMDDTHLWIGFYDEDGKGADLNIWVSKKGKLRVRLEDEGLGKTIGGDSDGST